MSTLAKGSPWFLFDRPPAPDDLLLLCLPYAGGGASVYRGWQAAMPPGVTLCRVQLPGRESRFGEPLLHAMPDLLEGLLLALRPWLGHRLVLFGHSMGGIVAAELVHALRDACGVTPLHLLISGSRPPHVPTPSPMSRLPSARFRQALQRDGGTPQEVIDCDELMALFEPILRADHTVLETWAPQPVRPLAVPLTVLAGLEDTIVPHPVVSQWQAYAAGPYRQVDLPAGHFFVRTHAEAVQAVVRSTLSPLLMEAVR